MDRIPTKYAALTTFGASTTLELLWDLRHVVRNVFTMRWNFGLICAAAVVVLATMPIWITIWQLLTGAF